MPGGYVQSVLGCPLVTRSLARHPWDIMAEGESALCSVGHNGMSALTKKAHRDRLGNDTVSLQYASLEGAILCLLYYSPS